MSTAASRAVARPAASPRALGSAPWPGEHSPIRFAVWSHEVARHLRIHRRLPLPPPRCARAALATLSDSSTGPLCCEGAVSAACKPRLH